VPPVAAGCALAAVRAEKAVVAMIAAANAIFVILDMVRSPSIVRRAGLRRHN
jgi:hypothetical protein